MNLWVSKDDTEYHYHTSHRAICGTSDILYNVAKTNYAAENPDVKCAVCIGILTSKGFFKVNQEKNTNMIQEAKFVQKYKTSPVHMMIHYLAAPDCSMYTIKKIRQELEGAFDEINVLDVLAEAIIRGDIVEKNGNFYPKCNGVIPL